MTKREASTRRKIEPIPVVDPPVVRREQASIGELTQFIEEVVAQINKMDSPADVAKIMVNTKDAPSTVKMFLVVKDDWYINAFTMRVYRFAAFPTDQFPVPHYGKFTAIGFPIELPFTNIVGFQWATPDQTEVFFDIHEFQVPN